MRTAGLALCGAACLCVRDQQVRSQTLLEKKNLCHAPGVLMWAVSRFVTGFCDSIQNSYRKLSMHELATELAMPARFVEMRHQATHKELPSLIRLKDIAAEALHWLWGWYWSRLDELVGGLPDEVSRRENLRLLREGLQLELKKYLSVRRAEVKRGAKGVKWASSEAGKEAGLGCVRHCLDRVEYLEVLVELLVDERAVIPSDKQYVSPITLKRFTHLF